MLKQININMQKFLVPLFDYLFGFALWDLGLTLMISLIFNVNCCFWRYLPKIIAIKIEQRSKNLILFSKIKLIFNPDADIILLSIFWHLRWTSNLRCFWSVNSQIYFKWNELLKYLFIHQKLYIEFIERMINEINRILLFRSQCRVLQEET